jgi:hypothetical protein
MHPSLNSEKAKLRGKKKKNNRNFSLYRTAMPPTIAAPRTPQAAVCIGTAAPLEVEVVDEEEPLCA